MECKGMKASLLPKADFWAVPVPPETKRLERHKYSNRQIGFPRENKQLLTWCCILLKLLWSIPDPVTEPNLLTADDPDPGQDTVASDSLSALAVAKWSWDSRALSGSITWTSWTIEGEAAWSRQSGVRPRCEHSLNFIQSRTKFSEILSTYRIYLW